MIMASVKPSGGSIEINSKELAQNLTTSATEDNTAYKQYCTRSFRKAGSRASSSSSKHHGSVVDTNSLIGQTLKIQDWLNDKTVEKLQEKSDAESKEARKLYEPLLETERTFVKGLDNYVKHEDLLALRKKERLHKRWTDNVYEPLRREIMSGFNWREIDRRKRIMYNQYLEFVNKKDHVFLHTLNPQEYYAQSLNGHSPAPDKVQVNRLRDPLISQRRERNEEDRTIMQCMTGHKFTDEDIEQVHMPLLPLVPLGRHGIDSISWLDMPLGDIESPYRQASRRRMRGILHKNSDIDLKNWSTPPSDPCLVDKELNIQKKRMYLVTPPFSIPPIEIMERPFIEHRERMAHSVSF